MAFITRNNADALIVAEVARDIISDVVGNGSRVLPHMTPLPQMSSHTRTIKVLSALPTAYFVAGAATTGEPGLKQTTSAAWDNVTLTAEELAVIVPIPEQILDDAEYDIWGQVKPLLVEAFGKAIDAAIYHGTNAPTSWPADFVTAATAASNVVASGSSAVDIGDDIIGVSGVYAAVEADGFMVRQAIGAIPLMAQLRGLRDGEDRPLFMRELSGPAQYSIGGVPLDFPDNGALDATAALLFAGDFKKFVYAMRQDITYKVLSEAVIYDTDGTTVLYNLAQQDMVALRAVMRLGWAAPNPVKAYTGERTGYPVGILTPAAGS